MIYRSFAGMTTGLVALAGALVLLASGCGPRGESAVKAQQVPGLTQLGLFYSFHVSQHQGKPPADEAAFKAYIKSLPPERLQQFKIENIDSMFVSPRDGKPYGVLYGGNAKRPARPGVGMAVAWEQDGRGGKRFVVDSLGKLDEVDQAKFEQMVPKAAAK
jgi:hypothetical protein